MDGKNKNIQLDPVKLKNNLYEYKFDIKYLKKYQNISKYIKTYQNMSKCIKNIKNIKIMKKN